MKQKECCLLEINVSENKRIVEIWLTNQEQEDDSISEFVQNTADKYSDKKYKVAVFMSGDNDLFDCTEGLIEHNLCL